jgi:hypothetical protein
MHMVLLCSIHFYTQQYIYNRNNKKLMWDTIGIERQYVVNRSTRTQPSTQDIGFKNF